MKKIARLSIISMIILMIATACSNTDLQTVDLFKFKDSYVGDNSAVGNITRELPSPNGEQIDGLELKTTEEPYGIIVNYKSVETTEQTKVNYEETALFNATYLFALVKNVDWVTFHFVHQELTVTREDLQNWYGKDLREFQNEDKLTTFAQKFLEKENEAKNFFK